MKIKLTLTISLFILINLSCTEIKENKELIVPDIISPINLLNCESDNYTELIESLEYWMSSMYPECDEFFVSYQKLSDAELEGMIKSMEKSSQNYLEQSSDSTLILSEYNFTDLSNCEPTIKYNETNSCSFYAGAVYHSTDNSVQFIRLFQKDVDEYMDLIIRIINNEVDVLAFG